MNFPSPDASDESEFVWPHKPVDGPMGDSYANVREFERLHEVAEESDIRYFADPPHERYVEMIGAEIIADVVLNLDDTR
jgi:hypothetical protein